MDKSLVIVEAAPHALGEIESLFKEAPLWGEWPRVKLMGGEVRAAYDVPYDSTLKHDVRELMDQHLPGFDVEISVCDPTQRAPNYSERSEYTSGFLDDIYDHADVVAAAGA